MNIKGFLRDLHGFYGRLRVLRGGVKIENRENYGQCPNRAGGGKKNQKCPNFNLGILKTEGGGLYFSKMSQFQLFDSVFCNITFIRNV